MERITVYVDDEVKKYLKKNHESMSAQIRKGIKLLIKRRTDCRRYYNKNKIYFKQYRDTHSK